MFFDEINTIDDVKKIISDSSSDDGENLYFELKGANNEHVFTKSQKDLLSKEICAFANTYGGILCFQYGANDTLEGFPESDLNKFNNIESWLKDSLEPKLIGIDIKVVSNMFLINIPESKTKPHRTNQGKNSQYYYRHSTQSVPMPEIMVSSMYKSHDFLDFLLDIEPFQVQRHNQLILSLIVNNISNLSGSYPKIEIEIFSDMKKNINLKGDNFKKESSIDFSISEEEKYLNTVRCSNIVTHSEFSQNLLYPKDILKVGLRSFGTYTRVSTLLLKVSCTFKEAPKKTFYKIVDFSKDNFKGDIVLEGYDRNIILEKFKELMVVFKNLCHLLNCKKLGMTL